MKMWMQFNVMQMVIFNSIVIVYVIYSNTVNTFKTVWIVISFTVKDTHQSYGLSILCRPFNLLSGFTLNQIIIEI